eukprot:2842588-Pyramimonas_sp.AAC.1
MRWQLNGHNISWQYIATLGILISEADDSPHGCTRAPGGLRPLDFQKPDSKIVAGVTAQKLSKELPNITHDIQRGFVPTRNFADDTVEID